MDKNFKTGIDFISEMRTNNHNNVMMRVILGCMEWNMRRASGLCNLAKKMTATR